MICHKELKVKNNVKNAKTGEPMWFSGFAIDAKVCERSNLWWDFCVTLYDSKSVWIIQRRLLPELHRLRPVFLHMSDLLQALLHLR